MGDVVGLLLILFGFCSTLIVVVNFSAEFSQRFAHDVVWSFFRGFLFFCAGSGSRERAQCRLKCTTQGGMFSFAIFIE